jgi:hypothetical protein
MPKLSFKVLIVSPVFITLTISYHCGNKVPESEVPSRATTGLGLGGVLDCGVGPNLLDHGRRLRRLLL